MLSSFITGCRGLFDAIRDLCTALIRKQRRQLFKGLPIGNLNPPSIDTQDFTDTKIFLRSWLFGTSSWFRSMKSNRRFFGII